MLLDIRAEASAREPSRVTVRANQPGDRKHASSHQSGYAPPSDFKLRHIDKKAGGWAFSAFLLHEDRAILQTSFRTSHGMRTVALATWIRPWYSVQGSSEQASNWVVHCKASKQHHVALFKKKTGAPQGTWQKWQEHLRVPFKLEKLKIDQQAVFSRSGPLNISLGVPCTQHTGPCPHGAARLLFALLAIRTLRNLRKPLACLGPKQSRSRPHGHSNAHSPTTSALQHLPQRAA